MRFLIFLALLEGRLFSFFWLLGYGSWFIIVVISLSSARKIPPRPARAALGDITTLKPSNEISKNDSQSTRKRRCLGTIIQLLWPQVVGPVDEGLIRERSYEEIPKTLLEHRLDRIRKKAREEEMSRLAVRRYMQEKLARISQVDFPDFHSHRLSFVDLFHRLPAFFGVLPERHVLVYK